MSFTKAVAGIGSFIIAVVTRLEELFLLLISLSKELKRLLLLLMVILAKIGSFYVVGATFVARVVLMTTPFLISFFKISFFL